MIESSIPVLRSTCSKAAERFYCGQLGFELLFAYRVDETKDDPCYLGMQKEQACLHVSSFPGDGVPGSVVYIVVDDVDGLHSQFVGKGVPIALVPTDQTWGNREMYVEDPDGNTLRFAQECG